MFGITFAAAELTKNFRAVKTEDWQPTCVQDKLLTRCPGCKRFNTALHEWIAFNHPNYRRYT